MISQKDIAARLGLDQSTVSYILSGRRLERYSEETQKRVLEMARKLDYRPSRAARLLRGERSGMIGVLEFDTRSSLVRRTLEAVCREIADRDYTPLPLDTNWFTYSTETVCHFLLEQKVEAVLLLGFGDDFAKRGLKTLQQTGIPLLVCFGLKVDGVPQIDIDRQEAFRNLTRLAIERGSKNPCFLGRPVTALRKVTNPPWDRARQGFEDALQEAGLRPGHVEMVTSVKQRPTDFAQSGRVGMEAILKHNDTPDAVICYNDAMALGAIAVCHEHGIRIPQDIAVYGFGEEETNPHLYPTLSSIKVNETAFANAVTSQLFQNLENKNPNNSQDQQTFLPNLCSVIERNSSPQP